MLNADALFFGALLIPAGRVSDKIRRKGVFLLGLVVFTIASLACAISPDLWVLIVFRGGTKRSAAALSECASRARSARQPTPTALLCAGWGEAAEEHLAAKARTERRSRCRAM